VDENTNVDVLEETKENVFNNIEKHRLLQWIVQLLCEFFVMLDYDGMNCNLVFGVFYNVFWSADSGYMQ
jgi:hypothetical protein